MALGPDDVRRLAAEKASKPWREHADEIQRIENNVDRALNEKDFDERTVGPNQVVKVKMSQGFLLRSQHDVREIITPELTRRFRAAGHHEVSIDWDEDTITFFNPNRLDVTG